MCWHRHILRALWLLPRLFLGRNLFIPAVAIIFVITGVFVASQIVLRWKRRLSYLIWAEKKKIFRYRVYDRVISRIRDIYNPSFSSVAIIFALVFIVWASALYVQPASPSTNDESQLITRLQSLDAGIALVFVPFTIFAVGLSSRRTESGVNAAEVLLSETYIFPITVFVLGLLTTFTLIKRVSWAKGLIFVTLAFATFAVYRLCQVLLDEERLYTSAIKLLQDKIRRTIGMALDERIGRNLLLKQLDGKPIEYSLSSHLSAGEYFQIKATRKGFVKDIDLNLLFEFVQDLENIANSYGFSFDEKQTSENSAPQQGLELTPMGSKNLRSNRQRYIVKIFGDEVTDRSDSLVFFSRVLVQDVQKRQQLAERARSAFHIKPGDSSSRTVERYLGLIKDQAIVAIKDQKTAYLESLLTVYAESVLTFLEEMKKAIGGHSFQAAVNERQNLFGGWNEMTWMSRHFAEIYYKGCRSEDIYIAKTVAAAPFRIAYSSIRYRDSLVFDQFTSFARSLYSALDDVKESKIRRLLFDTCLTYLKDIVNAGIELELERSENTAADLERIGSLATVILVRYQELLKLSFDKKNFEHFQQFKDGIDALFRYMSSKLTSWPSSPQFTEASKASLDEDRTSLKQQAERRKTILDIVRSVEHQKLQLFFAIGGYVFERAIPSDDSHIHGCLMQIDGQFPTNPFQLGELYLDNGKPDTDQLWGRAFYEDSPEGAWLDSRGTEYFCYLLLKFTHQYTDQQFSNFSLPAEPNFVANLREDGPIAGTFRNFRDDREKWKKVVPDDWLPSIPNLHQVFARATAKRKIAEDDQIIQTPIDGEYVKVFRARFVQEFENYAVMRKAFKHFKAYKDETPFVKGVETGPKWGLNVLDMKQAYTADGSKVYFNWPEEYARKLATSESEFMFHRILQELPECDLSGHDGLEEKIEVVIRESSARRIEPNVILVARQSPLGQISDSLKNFTPRWFGETDLTKIWGFLGTVRIQDRDAH